MSRAQRSRWALSFADLCLLLLGFFVLLQAHRQTGGEHALAGINAYFGSGGRQSRIDADIPATELFVPEQAMLTTAGRARIIAIAREARISGSAIHISSRGTDAGTARFDGWDLASARVGAVARGFAQAELQPDRIRIAGPDSDFAEGRSAQTLMIRLEHPSP